MSGVVGGLAVFGVVIALGWLLVRTGAVPVGSDNVLTRVCFFAATPALMFTTVQAADLGTVLSRPTAVALAAELLAVVSAWLLHRVVLRRDVASATIGSLASGYVNAGNLGIPVTVLVLGNATPVAPVLLLQLLVLTPLAFTVLDAVTRRGHPSRLGALTVALRNPLVLAVAAGVVANLAGWSPASVLGGNVATLLDLLGRMAVPLMMLALGMSVRGAPAPHARGADLALWCAVGWKVLVAPGLALALGAALGLRGPGLLVPVTTACLPTAQNVFMYASRYGVAKPLARDAVLLTTVAFVPVLLLAAAVLH